MKYVKLFEQFVTEQDAKFLNENISMTPRWANVFFNGIKKKLGAKKVEISKGNDMSFIDFDDKLRLFAKDDQIMGYNLDMSELPLELNKTIKSFNDIERNIKLFSGNDKAIKGSANTAVQLPTINKDGNKEWRNAQGQLHRLDGPAREWANGNTSWWQNGQLHRIDGPAVEWANGNKQWYQNGQLHRLDGPAIEMANGNKEWYLNDVKMTKKQFISRSK